MEKEKLKKANSDIELFRQNYPIYKDYSTTAIVTCLLQCLNQCAEEVRSRGDKPQAEPVEELKTVEISPIASRLVYEFAQNSGIKFEAAMDKILECFLRDVLYNMSYSFGSFQDCAAMFVAFFRGPEQENYQPTTATKVQESEEK